MPWSETNRMEQRARFVLEALQGRYSMSELCYRFSVSRKTGYKWIARYHRQGLPGCSDEPRRSRTHPNATDTRVVDQIIKARRQHPSWGPRTLRAFLMREHGEVAWPSPSTIGAILKRNGLVRGKRRRRYPLTPWRPARTLARQPNDVWTADFKGQFRLRNRALCYPLTVVDAYSRYLLVCYGLPGTSIAPTKKVFEAAFRTYGLPVVIHTDNGVPFGAPTSVLGLSTLSVWFLKLGIVLERSRPGKPQDNGSHERMHRTLKQDAVSPARCNQAAQQRTLNRFRRIYNEERPHHALQLQTPAAHYTKSERTYPEDLLDPQYPSHFELRRVNKVGVIKFRKTQVFVSEALRHENVGLECIAEDLWSVFYGKILLGRFSESDGRFAPGAGW